MKGKVLLIIGIIFFSIPCFAQEYLLDKGNIWVGAGVAFSDAYGAYGNDLGISIAGLYFEKERLAIGGGIAYAGGSTDLNGLSSDTYIYQISFLYFYAWGNKESKIFPFFEPGISLITGGSKAGEVEATISGFGMTLSGGIIIPLSKRIGISVSADYSYYEFIFSIDNLGEYKETTDGFGFSPGIIVSF